MSRKVETVVFSREEAKSSKVDAQQSESGEDPLAEITDAVEKRLDKNNEILLKKIEEKTELSIKEAIKRALEKKGWPGSSAAKKKKRKEPKFKSKGNEIRYEVNEEVIEKIDEAIKSIDEKEMEDAKKQLEEGKAIVTKQQKLIKMADREEHGWEVVKHYLSDDLADDSNDEKEIKKARKEALATIAKRNKKKVPFRNAPQYRSQKPTTDGYQRRYWGTGTERASIDRQAYAQRKSVCYKCGKEGHFQHNCPLKYRR